jgi:MFS family permease
LKLDYKKTIFVGLAFMLISMFWQAYDNLIGKILIDKFGLNQFFSGFVMALDNIFALFMLPLFGALSDKTNSKRGRRTPYIIVGTVVAAFALVGLSFVDNLQTTKIKSETAIVEEYENVKDLHDDVNEWANVTFQMSEGAEKTKINKILANYTAPSASDELSLADTHDVKEAYHNYLRLQAWKKTSSDPGLFVGFMIILLIALISMSVFRSPAVALMPDVTIKPLRSKANAVINLMGAFGGVTFLILSMILGIDKYSYVNYGPAFIIISVLMLVLLGLFLWRVKEPKLVEEKLALEKELGISDEDEEEEETAGALPKEKRLSLILILLSVFFWFMGYNAVISKLSDYAPKVLNMGFSTALLIANATAILGFIPIGILSSKIGRKKTILFGVSLLTVCFFTVRFLTPETGFMLYVVLGLTGIAWASINVNSYPMVVELSKGSNVGRYTGYYYAFSMAAQIVTPMLSGLFMDKMGRIVLFPYATICVVISLFTMLFVKHGDVKPEAKALLEHFDVED